MQPLQALNPQQQLEEEEFAENQVFTAEAMFHICGKMNCKNVCIWSMEDSHAVV
jgi:hypothetical protein